MTARQSDSCFRRNDGSGKERPREQACRPRLRCLWLGLPAQVSAARNPSWASQPLQVAVPRWIACRAAGVARLLRPIGLHRQAHPSASRPLSCGGPTSVVRVGPFQPVSSWVGKGLRGRRLAGSDRSSWIPAFAGMTGNKKAGRSPLSCEQQSRARLTPPARPRPLPRPSSTGGYGPACRPRAP